MRDFSEYNVDLNEKKLRGALRVFEKQLQTLEGADILVDGVLTRGIVYNNINPLSEEKEFRELKVKKDVIIYHGSNIVYENENYIVVTDIDDHYVYYSCKIRKCNQLLKWKGKEEGVPCIFTSNSYGAKGETHTNQFISDFDSRAMVLVQRNSLTEKIYEGMRFILGSEWDIYEITKKIGASMDGMWHLTVKYTRRVDEDDIENGIAWNSYHITSDAPNNESAYSIVGVESIKFNSNGIYSINKKDIDILWEIDADSLRLGIAEIVSQDVTKCEVKPLKKDTVFTLCARAKDDNRLLATYTIVTTRK
jgi:hypothetical protein